MIKISIGKGKFHIIFSNVNNFTQALSSSYLNQNKKRCWSLFSEKDNLIVVQPSVSTPGLNVLILKTNDIDKKKINGIWDMFKKDDIQIIVADYLRRSSQDQGFTVGFIKADNFIKALNTFYPSGKRCRAIVPKNGALLIQPSVSTPELNTLVLEHFDSIINKEKVEAVVASLEKINCDTVMSPLKTTNF